MRTVGAERRTTLASLRFSQYIQVSWWASPPLEGHVACSATAAVAVNIRVVVQHDRFSPVTCGVTYGEEDGLVFILRLAEGLLSPRHPMNWIVRVLQQIGSCLLYTSDAADE